MARLLYVSLWFCQLNIKVMSTPPQGWYTLYNVRYYFSADQLTWTAAQQACTSKGADLVALRGEPAEAELLDMLGTDQVVWWVGITDQGSEGSFYLSDGTPASYTDWFPGYANGATPYNPQPTQLYDPSSNQDCIELRRVFTNPAQHSQDVGRFYWNDATCYSNKRYICSQKVCGSATSENIYCTAGTRWAVGCIHRDKRLTGSSFLNATTSTSASCLKTCLHHTRCESANLHRQQRICELNGAHTSSVDALNDAPGVSFISTNIC